MALTSSQDEKSESESDGDGSSSSNSSDSEDSQGSDDSNLSGFAAVKPTEKSTQKPQAKSKSKAKVSTGTTSSASKATSSASKATSSASKRNGGKQSQTTPKKKPKPDVNLQETIDLLKSVSAHGIINPSNGTRDRDIQSKLTKARAALESIDSDEVASGEEASSLKAEIARVSFLKSLFLQLASEDTVVRVLDTDLVEQMTACGREDVSTVVRQLQIICNHTK